MDQRSHTNGLAVSAHAELESKGHKDETLIIKQHNDN